MILFSKYKLILGIRSALSPTWSTANDRMRGRT